MAGYKGFLFVESCPPSIETKKKEFLRALAQSHAAKASHPANRQDHPKQRIKQRNAGNFPLDDGPLLSEGEPTTSWEEDLPFNEAEPPPHQSRSRRQKPYIVQRWRIFQKSSKAYCLGGNYGDRSHWGRPVMQDNATAHMSIPIYKGNSDPFNSTSVPFTALDLTLVQNDRASMADLVWPAEISMRKNRQLIIDEIWKFMPSILSSPPVVHSIVSSLYLRKAVSLK